MRLLTGLFVLLCAMFWYTGAQAASQHDTVTYYRTSDETTTVAWDACAGLDVKYDLYLKRFEWNEIVEKLVGITETEREIQFPKSGLYIVMIRARGSLSMAQTNRVNGATDKEQLVSLIAEYNLTEDIPIGTMTIAEIKARILALGIASTWTVSDIDDAGATVDGAAVGWWVYSYIGSPGTIIISGNDQGPDDP